MRLSFNTWAYSKHSLEEAIKRIARIGYEGVEILAYRPHAWPKDIEKGERKLIRSLLESSGLKASAICPLYVPAGLNLASPREKIRVETTQYICDCIQLASDVGAKIVIAGGAAQLSFEISYEQAWTWAVDGFSKCASVAENVDVILALEPLARTFSDMGNTVDEVLRMANEIGSKNVQLMIDTEQSTSQRESLVDSVRKLGKRLVHVHIRDRSEDGKLLPPGRGSINFEVFIKVLKDINYDGYLSVELWDVIEPDGVALESKRFLDQIIGKI